jgi:16S rRNA G966 N2-methylase RsmD
LQLIVKKYFARCREQGFAATTLHACKSILRRGLYVLEDHMVGRAIAAETKDHLAIADMGVIESKNTALANEYGPTPTPMLVMWLIRKIVPKDRSAWTFIDVGAGKGRIVIAAASQGFRCATGIEFAGELCAQANRYLADLGLADGSGRVRVDQADATEFNIPPGPCLFYLYNPFREEILRRFITHVLISYANEPRALRFVYLNPVHKCAFAAQPELIEAALPPAFAAIFGIFSPYSVCVFETVTSNALDRN